MPCLLALSVVACVIAGITSCCAAEARADTPGKTMAVRGGWVYGLGGEVEWRPHRWGVSIGGGRALQYGWGGYLAVQHGRRPLGGSSWVTEAGLFRGVPNPYRSAPAGLGVYALGGYDLGLSGPFSVRGVLGWGIPFTTEPRWPTFEFLAKLTLGLTL